jgi:hypothetical protein
MKSFDWSKEKDVELKRNRDLSFEDVIFHIQNGDLLDILEHPNQTKYPNQKIFVLTINEYVYYVPFVENEDVIFLKTIIPSRKLLKVYKDEIRGGGN